MPFTPAHTVIVTPLLKNKNLSALGLIIGSVAPDFEYFFKFKVNSTYSHTLAGLFYFDLPVSFLLAWIFLKVIRGNLLSNLPIFLQSRFQDILAVDLEHTLYKRWHVFALSALLGAASHLLWDAFTHHNTFITANLQIYESTYIPYQGVKYPLWYALQHISTGVGLFVLAVYILMRKPTVIVKLSMPRFSYWIFLILVTAFVVWVRFKLVPYDLEVGNLVVTTITGLCIGLIFCGMIKFNNPILKAHQQDG